MDVNEQPNESQSERWLTDLWSAADRETNAPAGFDTRLFARIAAEDAVAAPSAPSAAAPILLPIFDALPWWVRAFGQRTTVMALVIMGIVAAWPALLIGAPAVANSAGAAAGAWLNAVLAPLTMPLLSRLGAPQSGLYLAIGLLPLVFLASVELARRSQEWTCSVRALRLGARH
jgi:hypothetical protein